MSTTLANITTTINDRRRSTDALSVDMTQGGFRAINGTLQTWNQEHDWPWQLEETQFNYNGGIDTYNIPSSWDFKAIVNVRPFKPANKQDNLYFVGQSKFDSDSIHSKRFATQLKGQTQLLRCQYLGYNATINSATSPTSNGTWVAAGAVSSLAGDTYDTFEQSSSISFNYSGTTGSLTNSTMTAIDLSRYAGRSNIYLNLNLQSVTALTSVTIKVGSSSTNYITASTATDYLGNTPVVGWNRFAFPWTGTVATVGTPVPTAIAYVQVTIAYGSNPATTSNNLENIWVSENIPMVVDYYSNNMVVDGSANKTQIFASAAATTDTPLWSGTWDFVNEPFVTSCMEIVSYLTGEQSDEKDAFVKVQQHLEPLKARLPSKRRYPQFSLVPDLNGEYLGPRGWPYNRYTQ